jgi:chitodextrinase
MRANSILTPVRSRALITALLLALLAALAPAQPAAAQDDPEPYEGWAESMPTVIRPGGTPRIDVQVLSWHTGEPAAFFDDDTTLTIDRWDGVPVATPTVTVVDALNASFVPPGDLAEDWYTLVFSSQGYTVHGYLEVRALDAGAWNHLDVASPTPGATSVTVSSNVAHLVEDTTVVDATLYPSDGGPEDITATTEFVREDDARGSIDLAAPLQPGDSLEVTLEGPGGTFEGWTYLEYPGLSLVGDALMEGATTGEVLRFEAYGFEFDGSETVRLRSWGVPIPRGALGTPVVTGPRELSVEVLQELSLGGYELVVTTAHGPMAVHLRVVQPVVESIYDETLVRSETPDVSNHLWLYGVGQGWTDATTVELVDLDGVSVAQAAVSLDSWSPVRQFLYTELDLSGVADGVHRVRITTGDQVDESLVVRVKGPYVAASWYPWDEGVVEVSPIGFSFQTGAEVAVRDRDGNLVGTSQITEEEAAHGYGQVEVVGDLADVVHHVTVEQDSSTYSGRFRPHWWWDELEVSPEVSAPGSRPDEFTLRDRGGDLSAQPISRTKRYSAGETRHVTADLPQRVDRERAIQRYPGGLEDGGYAVDLEDDGIRSYGWMQVGEWDDGPHLEADPRFLPSGFGPGDVRLRAHNFELDTDSDVTARLFTYDWWADEEVELEGVGGGTVVDEHTLDIAIETSLADGDYWLEIDIDGAIYGADFYVGWDEYPWLEADPYNLPAGAESLRAVTNGFTIAEDATLSAELRDGQYELLDVVGSVTRGADGMSVDVTFTEPLPDDYYEAIITINGRSFWVDFVVGEGPPRFWVQPWEVAPDTPTTVTLYGTNTDWNAETEVELFVADPWWSGAGFVDDIATSAEAGDHEGEPIDAILDVRVLGPNEIEVDLGPLDEDHYEFVVTTGAQVLRSSFQVRLPTSVTVTPSVIDPRTLPRSLSVSTLNLDLQAEDAEITIWGPNDARYDELFTATGPNTGTIALPAGAPTGWYFVDVEQADRYGWATFRILASSVSVSPSVITDASSNGRVLAVTARGFDLESPTVTLKDAANQTVPITANVRWWERLDVTLGQSLAPGRYTLTVTEDDTVASTTLEVVAAPPAGEPAPPRATVGEGTPGTVTTDPATGLVTATIGAFEVDDVTLSFPIPGCPPGDDIDGVRVLFNGQEVDADYDTGSCTGTVTISASMIRGEGGGTIEVEVERDGETTVTPIGEIVLYDPAGVVTDAESGDPIPGAVVTLYRAPELTPASGPEAGAGECQSSATVARDPETGKNLWNQQITREDGTVEPGDSPFIEPRPAAVRQSEDSKNPLVTTELGYYGWDVAEGCWFVHVVAEGYDNVVSPVVGIGPPPLEEVTDLDIAMQRSTTPVDTDPPVWVEGDALTARDVTTSQVVLDWPAATDASPPVQYQVRWGTDRSTGWVTDLTATISGLESGTSYSFAVFARDSLGNVTPAPLQTTVVTQTPPDTTPPVFGAGELVASDVTQAGLTLTWPTATDDRPGPVTYTVRRGETVLATGLTATTYAVTGLSPATEYTFSVTASDGPGNTTPTPLTRTVTTQSPPDATPPVFGAGELVASTVTQSSLTLTWPAATDAASPPVTYTVRRGATVLATGISATTFGVTGLTPNAEYTFTVRARDAVGNESTPLSLTVRTAKPPPPPPPPVQPPTCADAKPGMRFSDVDPNSTHGRNIVCSAGLDLVTGKGDGTYDPTGSLTRGQTATILLRALERSGVVLTAEKGFRDVPAGHPHGTAIRKLAAAGIVNGTSATTFDPGGSVTRAQFAALLDRASGVYFASYPEARNPFNDVSGVHAPAIIRLAGAGVIKGTSATTFDPSRNINRAQAASLFVRWLEDQAQRMR